MLTRPDRTILQWKLPITFQPCPLYLSSHSQHSIYIWRNCQPTIYLSNDSQTTSSLTFESNSKSLWDILDTDPSPRYQDQIWWSYISFTLLSDRRVLASQHRIPSPWVDKPEKNKETNGLLTSWPLCDIVCLTHIRPSNTFKHVNQAITSSNNGLLLVWQQANIWINARILSIAPSRTSFSEIWIKFEQFFFKKTHVKLLPENGSHFVSVSMCLCSAMHYIFMG